ncbi:hypothetical protein GCM10010254_75620 [Streptomyces chromofuscus]|nr:hypothetical protein GCM10010254_75620 [Streptomyces chromofuscus]
MAPLLSAAYLRTSALAPAGSVTEASAFLVAALDVGCAAGTAAAGLTLTAPCYLLGNAACLVLLAARHIGQHRARRLRGTDRISAPMPARQYARR